MGDKSKIAWTDASWNAVTGCSRVSPGCEHCYAETLSLRQGWSKKPWKAQFAAENVVLHPDRLDYPLRWRKPRRIFVNSMSDMFHEKIPDWYIFAMWRVMAQTPQHQYQILTKRPERMREWFTRLADTGGAGPMIGFDVRRGNPLSPEQQTVRDSGRATMFYDWVASLGEPPPGAAAPTYDWMEGERFWPLVLPNVWLGVSVEDQRRADDRIPLLLDTPAVVRFLSCEPLLGPLDLYEYLWKFGPRRGDAPLDGLHWIIDGGESGPGHRPDNQDWYRSIRDQCQAAGVAYFHKQSAGPRPGTGVELDGVIHHNFPEPWSGT